MDEPSLGGDEGQTRRRRPWFGLLLAAALLAFGAGAWIMGQPPPSATPRVLGGNQPVNAGAKVGRDISANNSPTLARNPTDPANLVVANRIDRPSFSCALHASFNGGASWEQTAVPFPAGEEDPPRCFAPDVAYASDGTLYVSFVTLQGLGNVPNAVWVVSSKDGGRTLSVPVKTAGRLSFQVQLTTDAAQPARLYLTWLQAEATGTLQFPATGYPIVSSTSTDGGATWSAPVPVSSPSRERVVAPSPAFGPDGQLYVLYLDLLEDRLDYAGAHEGRGGDPYEGPWALVLARSSNQGSTWEETVVDGGIRPTERFIVFLPSTPALAVDPRSGNIYVGFTDGRAGDADVNVWTSTDGGETFGSPVRVNDTPVGDGTSQYLPRLDVAPTGRLDVVYFDRRADLTNVNNEVSLQSSFDNARTFTRRVRVSDRAFDSRIGLGSELGLPDLGSRLALVSTNRRALAVWPDTRGGSEVTSKQDLASAVIDIPPPAATSRTWLRVVGAVAAALGVGSLVLALRTRRAPDGSTDADGS
ncbi:MAG: sialidase family protein [Acidimicrobiales bacterium]